MRVSHRQTTADRQGRVPSAGRPLSALLSGIAGQRPLHLLDAVGFNDVIDLDVIVAGDLHTALEALAHLASIVAEALERLQAGGAIRRRINHRSAADEADLGRPLDDALRDIAAGDRADLADLERLADDGSAKMHDLLA